MAQQVKAAHKITLATIGVIVTCTFTLVKLDACVMPWNMQTKVAAAQEHATIERKLHRVDRQNNKQWDSTNQLLTKMATDIEWIKQLLEQQRNNK
jgi:septal ring factor EnvC (AmiA/AmiB activator)